VWTHCVLREQRPYGSRSGLKPPQRSQRPLSEPSCNLLSETAATVVASTRTETYELEEGRGMESVRRLGGYHLPPGTTMADVRRAREELFASEGLDLLSGFQMEESDEETPQKEE
jgi:hypothetical protein